MNSAIKTKDIEQREKPCEECGSFYENCHVPFCSKQTLDQKAAQAETYYKAWLKENEKFWEYYDKLSEKIVFWQGKYTMVKQENNKLRRKLYRLKNEEQVNL